MRSPLPSFVTEYGNAGLDIGSGFGTTRNIQECDICASTNPRVQETLPKYGCLGWLGACHIAVLISLRLKAQMKSFRQIIFLPSCPLLPLSSSSSSFFRHHLICGEPSGLLNIGQSRTRSSRKPNNSCCEEPLMIRSEEPRLLHGKRKRMHGHCCF